MRLFFFVGLLGLTACLDGGDELDEPKRESTEIVVFGISQRTDATSGKTITTAGHEYLSTSSAAGTGWATNRQSWPDGWCRRFATANDGARRHPPGGGRAHFAGGRLGNGQIVLDANGADPTIEGAAFEPERPMLFDVDSGFGIAKFEPVEVPVPNTSLVVRLPVRALAATSERAVDRAVEPADPGDAARERGALVIDGARGFSVEWTPREDADASVMIAFDTDDRRDHVRCFVREKEGAAAVHAEHFQGIRSGTLTIASHRSAIVKPGDGKLVEIVSMVVASEQRFVVR